MSNYMNPYMNPYGQRPMWQQPGTPQMPARQLLRVSGINGAKAFQMNPNEVVALFDEGDDILYVKSTDSAGFPTIRRFRFAEEAETPAPAPPPAEYVTRKEFDELKGMVMAYGKQPVSESPAQQA